MAGDKFLYINAGTITEKVSNQASAGAGDAGKVVALDSTGRIDNTMMPVGIGADTATITASEALAAGDFVNVWNSTGAKVRKADASTSGKEAHGFVLAAVSSSASATVYFEGTNTQVTGATAGVVYLSASTPGASTATAPSSTGQVVQRIGFATGTTAINFQSMPPIVLA
jgi:hypothetical protein